MFGFPFILFYYVFIPFYGTGYGKAAVEALPGCRGTGTLAAAAALADGGCGG